MSKYRQSQRHGQGKKGEGGRLEGGSCILGALMFTVQCCVLPSASY